MRGLFHLSDILMFDHSIKTALVNYASEARYCL